MKITYDSKADAMHIRIHRGRYFGAREINEDTIIHLDKKGNVLGIELLDVLKRMPVKQLTKLRISTFK